MDIGLFSWAFMDKVAINIFILAAMNRIAPPPDSRIKILIPSMMVFGDRDLGKWSGSGEVMRVGPSWWDYWSYKKRYHFHSVYHVRRNSRKVVISNPGIGVSAEQGHISIDIGLLASRTVTNTFLLLSQQKLTDTSLWTCVLNSPGYIHRNEWNNGFG